MINLLAQVLPRFLHGSDFLRRGLALSIGVTCRRVWDIVSVRRTGFEPCTQILNLLCVLFQQGFIIHHHLAFGLRHDHFAASPEFERRECLNGRCFVECNSANDRHACITTKRRL